MTDAPEPTTPSPNDPLGSREADPARHAWHSDHASPPPQAPPSVQPDSAPSNWAQFNPPSATPPSPGTGHWLPSGGPRPAPPHPAPPQPGPGPDHLGPQPPGPAHPGPLRPHGEMSGPARPQFRPEAAASPTPPAGAQLTNLLDGSPIQRHLARYRQSYGNYITGLPTQRPGEAPPVVVDRAFPPLSMSTYRGLSIAVAWLIGFPFCLAVIFGIVSLLNPMPFSSTGPEGVLAVFAYVVPALSVIAPAVFGSDIGRNPALRWISSGFYALVAFILFLLSSYILALASTVPGVRGAAAGLSGGLMVLVVLAATVTIVPFLPDSNAFMRRLALFRLTVDRVDSGRLSLDEARAQAVPPISVPRNPLAPPSSINAFTAVFTAVCVINLGLYSLLPSLGNSQAGGSSVYSGYEAIYIPAIILSLIALAVWIFAAVRTRAGSQAARVFLTVMFTGTALLSLIVITSSESMFVVGGVMAQSFLPGWYRPIEILLAVVLLISTVLMLYFLYRPDSNKYFAGMHYLRNATPQDGRDLEQALAVRANQRQALNTSWPGAQPAPGTDHGSQGWNGQDWDNSDGWH